MSYDSAGNLTADKDGYEYQYDYENRIVKITKDGNDIAEFAYDALGRRIEKKDSVAGTTTRYYYNDNWQVLCEYNDSDVLQRAFVYGNYIDEVLCRFVGSLYFYVHDHLYSPVALLKLGVPPTVERYEYDAYGRAYILEPNFAADPDGKSDVGNPYLFTGRRVDFLDNGSLTLQYNRHRYYDYYTGRWTTQDPLGYMDGMNLYEYARSNPTILIDPWGLGVYSIGGTLPPRPAEGPGAGPYASEIPCLGDWTLWSFYFWAAGMVSGTVPHASAHLEHFLDNSGDEYTVDVADMVSESITAKRHFYKEINDAMRAAEETPCSMTSFTLVSNWTSRSIGFKESADWNLAVARYYAAGKADVTRIWGTPVCTYQMKFTFNFSDKYDWDRGAVFKTIGPLTLSADPLGRLHRVGLAQEFWMKGETSRTFTWQKGQRFDTNSGTLLSAPSGAGAGAE